MPVIEHSKKIGKLFLKLNVDYDQLTPEEEHTRQEQYFSNQLARYEAGAIRVFESRGIQISAELDEYRRNLRAIVDRDRNALTEILAENKRRRDAVVSDRAREAFNRWNPIPETLPEMLQCAQLLPPIIYRVKGTQGGKWTPLHDAAAVLDGIYTLRGVLALESNAEPLRPESTSRQFPEFEHPLLCDAMTLGYLSARLEAETALDRADKRRSRKATIRRTSKVEIRRDQLVSLAKKGGWEKGAALNNEVLRALFHELKNLHPEYERLQNRTFHNDARLRGLK